MQEYERVRILEHLGHLVCFKRPIQPGFLMCQRRGCTRKFEITWQRGESPDRDYAIRLVFNYPVSFDSYYGPQSLIISYINETTGEYNAHPDLVMELKRNFLCGRYNIMR